MIHIDVKGASESDLERYRGIIYTLFLKDVLNIKDGSAQLFFDDVGVVQKIIYKKKRRKREGESISIFPLDVGKATGHYRYGELVEIEYETEWNKKYDVNNTLAQVTNTTTITL